jgi:hypothetical protein
MSFLGGILGELGVGNQAGYSFDQQQKDFIKLQFKYGLLLKNRLADGTITPDYYQANFWLTTETLDPPYNGWLDEFKSAIEAEDLNWLSKQVGETVEALTAYMGSALRGVAAAAGSIVGTAISSTAGGLASGFFGSLTPAGWLVIGGTGVAIYFAWKKGLIQRAFGHEINKLIP